MLLTTARPTTAIIFGYSKNIQGNPRCKQCRSRRANISNDDLMRQASGYQIKFHEQVVRYDLQIQVVEMDIYVAPTIINLENPTFFVKNLGEVSFQTSDLPFNVLKERLDPTHASEKDFYKK